MTPQNGRISRTGIIQTGMPVRGPLSTWEAGRAVGMAAPAATAAAAGMPAPTPAGVGEDSTVATAAAGPASPPDAAAGAGAAAGAPPAGAADGALPPGRPRAARRCRERSSRYSGTSVTPTTIRARRPGKPSRRADDGLQGPPR